MAPDWPAFAVSEDEDRWWVRADLSVVEVLDEFGMVVLDEDGPGRWMPMLLEQHGGPDDWRIVEAHPDEHDHQDAVAYIGFGDL